MSHSLGSYGHPARHAEPGILRNLQRISGIFNWRILDGGTSASTHFRWAPSRVQLEMSSCSAFSMSFIGNSQEFEGFSAISQDFEEFPEISSQLPEMGGHESSSKHSVWG